MNSSHSIDEIKSSIDNALKTLDRPPVAAFDADGTLWSHDAGEGFFKYECDHQLLKDLPADPWQHYIDMHTAKSPQEAFLWLAQINRGHSLDEVRKWAKDCVQSLSPLPTFDFQKQIIEHLHQSGVKVYIVTASIKWAVEPAAELYNIPQEHVIGFQTKIENNIVTDEPIGAYTWREGKVEGLLIATEQNLPFFASGNTMGDLALLESSSDLRLVVRSAHKNHVNFETEKELINIAKDRRWFYFEDPTID